MDWTIAIEKQREALAVVIAGLIAMAGRQRLISPLAVGSEGRAETSGSVQQPDRAEGGGSVQQSDRAEGGALAQHPHPPLSPSPTSPPQGGRLEPGALPRPIYRSILRVLRPAESALRRLIVIVAAALCQKACRRTFTRHHPRACPGDLPACAASSQSEERSKAGGGNISDKEPGSPPVDSRHSVEDIAAGVLAPLGRGAERSEAVRGRLKAARPLPDFSTFTRHDTLPAFPLIDPRKRFGEMTRPFGAGTPRFSVPGIDDPARSTKPDNTIQAAALLRRIRKLQYALNTLPRQARRLNRLVARREKAEPGPGRLGPLRPGYPPGHRKKPRHEVDDILRECHWLALDCDLKPP